MKQFLTTALAALALMLTTGLGVRAEPVPPASLAWTYNFTPGAPAVFGDGTPSAGVTFTNEPTKPGTVNTDVVATNLSVFSTASSSSPNTLTTSGAYSLTLVLSANDNGTIFSAPLTFMGKLGGSFASDSSNITNTPGPNSTQSVTLGSYTFTVTVGAYTPPGPPNQTLTGALGAHIDVSTVTLSEQAPEPGTMLMSCLGLGLLGGAAWRRKRRQTVSVEAPSTT